MKRVIGVGVALVCVALLSSCSLLPGFPGGIIDVSGQQADVEMQRIMDAVKHHDAAALKKLFSPHARETAIGLDSGLKYFLSIFPSGLKSLGEPDGGPGESEDTNFGTRTVELDGNYKVSANGKLYIFHFDYYPVNQVADPNNVGLVALGVAPYNADPFTKPTVESNAFYSWTGSFWSDFGITHGSPGVYVANPRFAAAYSGNSKN